MDHFSGLDVSVKETSVCIVDDTGRHPPYNEQRFDTATGHQPEGGQGAGTQCASKPACAKTTCAAMMSPPLDCFENSVTTRSISVPFRTSAGTTATRTTGAAISAVRTNATLADVCPWCKNKAR
jgi:hypothetical protein